MSTLPCPPPTRNTEALRDALDALGRAKQLLERSLFDGTIEERFLLETAATHARNARDVVRIVLGADASLMTESLPGRHEGSRDASQTSASDLPENVADTSPGVP